MRYELVMPQGMREELSVHLLRDRTREQMAIVLCGTKRRGKHISLLGRHLILMPPEAFTHQSAGGLELAPEVQCHVLQLAAEEGLSQVDWHTHPGSGSLIHFSCIDDDSERRLAAYLAERLPGTFYASVVTNGEAVEARVWETRKGRTAPAPLSVLDFIIPSVLASSEETGDAPSLYGGRFDRQVQAFGREFQRRLAWLTVGIVGLGGLGSILAEELTRLGVRTWVLVDPDYVEASNLNRLLGATLNDVKRQRTKVAVATRNILRIDSNAQVKTLQASVYEPSVLKLLTACDLIIAATDNHASRLTLNALSCQYLIPIVHVGVNLERGDEGSFHDISGEFAIPNIGAWCLLCANIINTEQATWDLASPEERSVLAESGYLTNVPAPAVYHLNGVVASLAVSEIHNVISAYKPLRRYLVYRELEAELIELQVPTRTSCLHCTPEGLLGLGDLAPFWSPRRDRTLSEANIPRAEMDLSLGKEEERLN
jgi:hypothetical protein